MKQLSLERSRGAIVYHLQQFVERLCKAVIAALGFEPPKSHTPSIEIDRIVASVECGELNLVLDRETLERLRVLSSLAKTLEDEKTRPRYGVRHARKIIPPNEYYTVETVKLFIEDAKFIASLVVEIFERLGLCKQFRDVCGDLREVSRDPA